MENKQLSMYPIPEEPDEMRNDKKARRNWENGFQRWSNEAAQDERNSLGVCGYGVMCDFCSDNTYGRPCVRALNEMCRNKKLVIDYQCRDYEKVWEGRFKNEK